MKPPVAFSDFIGNRRVVEVVRRAVWQNRLPHAMIFAGPSGVGKKTLALLLARMVNCAAPAELRPCGECIACRKILSGVHPDVRVVQPDGAFIKIDQVREIITETGYQPFEAHTRLVIFDGADQMRTETSNCLLKTLEEPPSRSVLVLVTTKPYVLLSTIRSRARTLQFGGIPGELVEDCLVRQMGLKRDEARLAALFSRGSLSTALAFDSSEFRQARQKALEFASLLLTRGSFMGASALANGIARDKKDKEGFVMWLEALTSILQDIYYSFISEAHIRHVDLKEDLRQLASHTSRPAVVSVLRSVETLRLRLNSNINRQVAVEALFLSEAR